MPPNNSAKRRLERQESAKTRANEPLLELLVEQFSEAATKAILLEQFDPIHPDTWLAQNSHRCSDGICNLHRKVCAAIN